jgi:hypothetical protein
MSGRFKIVPSPLETKKWRAIFPNGRTTDFGQRGFPDYTTSGDKVRRRLYLLRHASRENWNDPYSAGSLSRHILWGNSTNIQKNIADFKSRFNLD